MDIEKIIHAINEELIKRHLTIKDLALGMNEHYSTVYRFLMNQVMHPKIEIVFKMINHFELPDDIVLSALGLSPNTKFPLSSEFISDESNRSLGEIIKEKTTLKHLSYKELATRVGIAQSYLSRLINTPNEMNLLIALKFCQELSISYPELKWCLDLEEGIDYSAEFSDDLDGLDFNTDVSFKRFLCLIRGDVDENSKENGFVNIHYAESKKSYILMSPYSFYELGILLKEYIEFVERRIGVGNVTILSVGELKIKELLDVGAKGTTILSAGEYANQIKSQNLHHRFKLLYFLLRNIELKEKNGKK